MSKQNEQSRQEKIAYAFSEMLREGWAKSDTLGVSSRLNIMRTRFEGFARDLSFPELCELNPYFALVVSLVGTLKDALFTSKISMEVIEKLEIDEAIKKGLYLSIRGSQLDSLTGPGGHMIESKNLIKEISGIEEIPAQELSKLIEGLRKAHYDLLHKILIEKLDSSMRNFIKHISKVELKKAKDLLINCIDRLNVDILKALA